MVMTTHETTIKENAELVKVFLAIHRKATEYAMSNRAAFVDMASQKLGQPKPTIEIAAPNVELTWNTDADWVTRAKYYGSEMLDKKQILPCSVFLQGEYGIRDLFVGVPVKLGARGLEQVIEIKLTPEEDAALKKSAGAVKELVDVIGM